MKIYEGLVSELPAEGMNVREVPWGVLQRDFVEISVMVKDSDGEPVAGSGTLSFEGSINGTHWRAVDGDVDLSLAGSPQTYEAPVAVGGMLWLRATYSGSADDIIEIWAHRG